MGLDMYMYVSEYESRFDTNKKGNFYPKKLEDFEKDISERNFVSKETKYQVGYWRKFNALHNYIVEHFADGNDDCRPVYIGYNELELLRNVCKDVLDNHDLASELLPTQDGFFFGSTEYDEWYFENLEYSLDLFNKLLEFCNKNPSTDIYYKASW